MTAKTTTTIDTLHRAENLRRDGYHMWAGKGKGNADTYFVSSPEGEAYTLVLEPETGLLTCTCPAYRQSLFACKHAVGVALNRTALDAQRDADNRREAAEIGRYEGREARGW